jgi:hypothetical protein
MERDKPTHNYLSFLHNSAEQGGLALPFALATFACAKAQEAALPLAFARAKVLLAPSCFCKSKSAPSCFCKSKRQREEGVRYDQTYPGHKEYLLSLYDIFKNLTGTPPRIHNEKQIREQIKFIKQ